MKKLAPIFVLILAPLMMCACKTSGGLGMAKFGASEQLCEYVSLNCDISRTAISERANFVIEYIYLNYEEYNFDRYLEFGVENLITAASDEEFDEIKEKTMILENAILEGVDLSQKNLETASGATKTVFDIDELLFSIWHRENRTKK